MHCKHLMKTYLRTQSTIALSSAEAELYATVQGASEGLGMAAMALDFGRVIVPWMYVDASAAIGIAQRKGLGNIRHLHTYRCECRTPFEKFGSSSTSCPGPTTPPTCIQNILMPRRC